MHAVIIGATGGIGRALTAALVARSDVEQVHALSRSGAAVTDAKATPGKIDILDETSIIAAAEQVKAFGAPDLVIVASGVLTSGADLQPEKSYRQQTLTAFEQVFAINTFGPGLVAKHFLPIMPRQGWAVFAALSARVGSITDNRLGGWHAYRASKAALNMLIRNYAIEQARRNPDFIAVALHPGTVDTALTTPFQNNVPAEQLFTPDRAATALLDVIDTVDPAVSGRAIDWAGIEIPA